MADAKPVLFYSPHWQLDTSDPDEYNATKDEDRQVRDCDQNTELCGTDLLEATGHPAVTQPTNMEESQAIYEKWENDTETTLTHQGW